MIHLRPGNQRGTTRLDWLLSRHTFSFGEYHHPEHMGFRSLRVINDDVVHPGKGFGTHPHRDMEILTLVLDGALEHKDSLGTGSVIRPGEIQRMSAGTGILHSEWNHSATEPVHFLQVWILPERARIEPGYEQRTIPAPVAPAPLAIAASPDGRGGSVTIHQDAELWTGTIQRGEVVRHAIRPGRALWLHVAHGAVAVGGSTLVSGDGVGVEGEPVFTFRATEPSEVLLFDLA